MHWPEMKNLVFKITGPGKKNIPNINNTFVLLGKESLWAKNLLTIMKRLEGVAKN